MVSIQTCELPSESLLIKYLNQGAYVDCYTAEVDRLVSHAEFVEAFYSTGVFKLERRLLTWFAGSPSTDEEISELASGQSQGQSQGQGQAFAIWSVEARAPNQLLLCDFQNRTRSWLMVAPGRSGRSTRLFFGSAVVPIVDRSSGHRSMGFAFRALLGFHKLYSRVLLHAALKRIKRVASAVQ